MFNVETVVALLNLVVDSNARSGRTTNEYKGLHSLLMQGVGEVAPTPSGILSPEEIYDGQNRGKLTAIKMYKERTKESLMDSKRAVEKYFADNGLVFYRY